MTLRFMAVWILALALLPASAAVREEFPAVPDIPVPAQTPKKSPEPLSESISRGRLLYENHCTRCHASVLHVRENRRADSLKSLEAWVRRWSGEEKLDWSAEEVVEVVDYLNQRYYKFAPPGRKK